MDWSPERVRALRGDRTRAELAVALGVSPLTIYRWELPDDAPEARRPRRGSRALLDALAEEEGSGSPSAAGWEPDAAILHLLGAGRWADAESRALEALASGTAKTPADRAFLQTCIAKIQLMCRNDVRGALATMAPVLATVDALPTPVQDLVHAAAAALYATPDGHLFDAGRAASHAGRVSPDAEPNMRALSIVAAARAAWHLGDAAAFTRRIAAERAALAEASEPPIAVLTQEVLALYVELEGRPTEAVRRLQGVADRAESLGMAPVAARSLGHAALLRLLNAEHPDAILPSLDRAERLCIEARATPGEAELVVLGARCEGLFRSGRFEAARAVYERCNQLAISADWPALELSLAQCRLDFHCGGAEASRAGFDAFERTWGHRTLPSFEAVRAFLEGTAFMCEGELERSAPILESAFHRSRSMGTRPWLTSSAGLLWVGSLAYFGDAGRSRAALDDVERHLERHPAPWSDLLLCHVRGLVATLEGRAIEAYRLFETAQESLDRAGDICEAARIRRASALAAWVLGESDAQERLERTEAELEDLGIALAPVQQRDRIQRDLFDRRGPAEASLGLAPAVLVVPFRRLATRGFDPRALLGEIESSARQLLGDPDVRLTRGSGGAGARVSFGDGFGNRWTLTASGEPDPGKQAALELLGTTAGLALELATLRSGGPTAPERSSHPELPDVIAESASMRALLADLRNVARSSSTVLIQGESGCGKEVVASAVHRLSPRRDDPFVTFNSAATPAELFEGQLFGYRKGAFTGANQDHPGVIRAADGGSLFLDEIGDMPLAVQAKLLRFLENGEVLPLGETRPVKVDIRVVAATHRDLARRVAEGQFREDLYYRLQVVVVRVPALRERPEDILPLARFFLEQRGDRSAPHLSADALVALREHAWPGNVRELRNAMERALAYAPEAAVLDASMLRLRTR